MQIDLEPGDYRLKGAKEPILHPMWKVGLVLIFLMFAIPIVLSPLMRAAKAFLNNWWWGIPY